MEVCTDTEFPASFLELKFHSLFTSLGIYQFRNNSLKPSDINSNTNVILLIVTRWTSFDLRGALRQMLKNDNRTKFEYKTIFLFNYDDSASKEDIKRIEDENTVYKGGLFSLHIFSVVICTKVNCKIAHKHLTVKIATHYISFLISPLA